jgi:hypothetical protein
MKTDLLKKNQYGTLIGYHNSKIFFLKNQINSFKCWKKQELTQKRKPPHTGFNHSNPW